MLGARQSLFVHIAGCAGTSIEAAIGAGPEQANETSGPARPRFDVLSGGGLEHLTIREIRENHSHVLATSGLFRFSVVRDPIDRFFATCAWHAGRHKGAVSDKRLMASFELLRDRLAQLRARRSVFEDPTPGGRWCEGDPSAVGHRPVVRHLIPQTAYLFDSGRLAIDAVYHADFMTVLERDLRRRGAIANVTLQPPTTKASKRLRSLLRSDDWAFIKETYREDFRFVQAVRRHHERRDSAFRPKRFIRLFRPNQRHAVPAKKPRVVGTTVPRKLWLYWHQGWDQAPELIARCARSWTQRNPGWDVRFLTGESAPQAVALPEFYGQVADHVSIAAASDILRIYLLASHGGVWADAATWCARPLDEWLDYVAQSGFFAYAKPKRDRPLSSWFLVAAPGNAVAVRQRDATVDFWRRAIALHGLDGLSQRVSYFWFHYLFDDLLKQEAEFAKNWRLVPEILARSPQITSRTPLGNPPSAELEFHIRNRLSNVYKLRRRRPIPDNPAGTGFELLFDTLDEKAGG